MCRKQGRENFKPYRASKGKAFHGLHQLAKEEMLFCLFCNNCCDRQLNVSITPFFTNRKIIDV